MSVLVGAGPQVKMFGQVSTDDHQMAVVGGLVHVWYLGRGVPISHCIMGNGHMWTLPEQNDRQTPVKTLPSHNFVFGR